jgi:hypothetical protein
VGRYPAGAVSLAAFVEELCSAQGMTVALMSEIERVIFESHSLADRDGAVNFDELLDMRATRFRETRAREETTLADLSERIGIDLEKDKLVPGLKKQAEEKQKAIKGYERDRAKLITKGSEARVSRLAALTAAAEKVRGYVRAFAAREQNLLMLQDEVENFRTHQSPEALRRMQERYRATNLKGDEWSPFLLDYTGDVDATLNTHRKMASDSMKSWKGTAMIAPDPKTPLISDDAELDRQNLALLEAEIAPIEKLMGADRETTAKFAALSKRIVEETAALERLKERLTDCEGAMDRVKILVQEREAAYVRVFEAVVAEQNVLIELYSPLMTRLDASGGTVKKLAFSVRREADVGHWADDGEELLDLRVQGSFKGRGTLRQLADAALKEAWETGDPKTISAAMAKFRKENQAALLDRAPVPKADQANYREWSKSFAKWLYGTEHIQIQYSIDYDGNRHSQAVSGNARHRSFAALSRAG